MLTGPVALITDDQPQFYEIFRRSHGVIKSNRRLLALVPRPSIALLLLPLLTSLGYGFFFATSAYVRRLRRLYFAIIFSPQPWQLIRLCMHSRKT